MNHEKYIARCLELAKMGLGKTRPNPSVGAVVVYEDKIIGEGFTSPYGGPHAEVNAINSVKQQELLEKAIIYVTLEPCSHYGKTPPCADLIVAKKIPSVVIGCIDTNSLVAGKGIKRLEKAGCNVTVGVLEEECFEHHKRFFTVQNKQRPYIILKWAETKNGYIAPLTKEKSEPVWISNRYSQQLVHKWRSQEHAILVGTNTVRLDNPSLNVRSWKGNNPVRVIIDRYLKLPLNSNVFSKDQQTIVICEKSTDNREGIMYETIDFSKDLVIGLVAVLNKHKIQSIIIEGGTKTLQQFIDSNLWDEAKVFIGEGEFDDGIKGPVLKARVKEEKRNINDIITIYRND
ncbi:bifunctional diaminohydroxyphosphoribosylaminopyrimidine deaminase/5-amino-6-(5-phosphoribosylamino)uracil reductase RibD [Tenacibaculum sp. MAR_2009_124]|uniref:bifunctional diaminohydroxyphosphoribosylaminopyrimidine deaminase/5-amino-6-(5-phosphoribosylamino)uracil reductase RibD n=1 Tax=Tenacibaculum sp. MAR_2009_124 TaxID=1250059 RepID=UPI0021009A16|nr:bifunctional diaminohydroxyphosphoribosylaminopyrimidine deaminase/5-amino-6-(5-phosphoribosylamino)uracil reductase RibD [Tenacibaculum sp. MAR_2009_124]